MGIDVNVSMMQAVKEHPKNCMKPVQCLFSLTLVPRLLASHSFTAHSQHIVLGVYPGTGTSCPGKRRFWLIESFNKLYSRTLLFRTRLIRSPRYFEWRSNSLGFTLMFSVIYYKLFRTRLLRIPHYFELILLSLHLKSTPAISNLSKTEYVHKRTAGNVLHFIWARVA